MFGIEYSEVRSGEWMTFVRKFYTRAEAEDFYNSMRRTGTPADRIERRY